MHSYEEAITSFMNGQVRIDAFCLQISWPIIFNPLVPQKPAKRCPFMTQLYLLRCLVLTFSMKLRKPKWCCLKSAHVKIKSAPIPVTLLVFTCTDLGLWNFGLQLNVYGATGLSILLPELIISLRATDFLARILHWFTRFENKKCFVTQ